MENTMGWAAAIQAAGEIGTAWMNSTAQHKANRTNISLQKRQQEWEQMMSNTAVQRRADDIEKAGGNRALAFVNGSEASTPSIAPARIEPARIQAPNIGNALMIRAQLDNLKANTANTSADTRNKILAGNLTEEFGGESNAQDVVRKRQENEKFKFELDKAIADADISRATADMLREKTGAAIELMRQNARMGELNADSAEAIVEKLGIVGKDAGPIAKLLIELAKAMFLGR